MEFPGKQIHFQTSLTLRKGPNHRPLAAAPSADGLRLLRVPGVRGQGPEAGPRRAWRRGRKDACQAPGTFWGAAGRRAPSSHQSIRFSQNQILDVHTASSLRRTHHLRWGASPPASMDGFTGGSGPTNLVFNAICQWAGLPGAILPTPCPPGGLPPPRPPGLRTLKSPAGGCRSVSEL